MRRVHWVGDQGEKANQKKDQKGSGGPEAKKKHRYQMQRFTPNAPDRGVEKVSQEGKTISREGRSRKATVRGGGWNVPAKIVDSGERFFKCGGESEDEARVKESQAQRGTGRKIDRQTVWGPRMGRGGER